MGSFFFFLPQICQYWLFPNFLLFILVSVVWVYISLSFWFVFSCKQVAMNIYSYAYWLSICSVQEMSVHLCLLPIADGLFVFLVVKVVSVIYYMLALYKMYCVHMLFSVEYFFIFWPDYFASQNSNNMVVNVLLYP